MKKLLAVLMCIPMLILCGFDSQYNAVVSAVCEPTSEIGITATYTGLKELGTKLEKEQFEVYKIYSDGNKSYVSDERVSYDDYEIYPDKLSNKGLNEIVVTSNGKSCVVPIFVIEEGNLIIKTENIEAELTVDAVIQDGDSEILKNGLDVVYTIKCEEKNSQISNSIADALAVFNTKTDSVTVLQAYDINIKREVDGIETGLITSLEKKIYLRLNIPDKFKSVGASFYVAHEHDGNIELLRDLDDSPDTITISSGTFSDYVLYKVEKKPGNKEDDSFPNKATPSTKVGHIHSFKKVEKSASCTETGYTKLICENCSDVIYCETELPLGHNWLQYNEHQYRCLRCGLSKNIGVSLPIENVDFVERSYDKYEIGNILDINQEFESDSTSLNGKKLFYIIHNNKSLVLSGSTIYMEQESSDTVINEEKSYCWIWLLLFLLILIYIIYKNIKSHKERKNQEE